MHPSDPIVSDLVLRIVRASSRAIAIHYSKVFETAESVSDEYAVCRSLEDGNMLDLLDRRTPPSSFQHLQISRLFRSETYSELRDARINRRIVGINRHIWGADYDWRLSSLLPTGAAIVRSNRSDQSEDPIKGRTRVSSIVQQSLLKSRRILQSEKATTAIRDPYHDIPSVFVPSPFNIAAEVLTDPSTPATRGYAEAAIRTELRRRIEQAFGARLTLDHETISRALDLIWNRFSTSKKVRAGAVRSGGEALFLCHHLASQGVASLEIEWRKSEQRVDRFFGDVDNIFDLKAPGGRGFQISFRFHPDYVRMPDAAELLNEMEGISVPVEGMNPIFFGGLRFASEGSLVAAISGPFGAGKTSVCLSLAASLAPLGCRTLFLSCEESADAIKSRLAEATPEHVVRNSPLFRCITLDELRSSDSTSTWFQAHSLRLNTSLESNNGDVAEGTKKLIERAVRGSALFKSFRSKDDTSLPPFARPIIIVDGLHQLFQESRAEQPALERSLRSLIDYCRSIRAIFIFTVASGRHEMERLDYLCDLVIGLDRSGVDRPEEFATRIFKVLKARKQPAMIGAHTFHISGPKAFRVKPNVSTHAEHSKSLRWFEPELHVRIPLQDDVAGFSVQNRSQVLVYGKGSSGKAGLGLYLLHRRPMSSEQIRSLANKEGDERAVELPFYESRTLVISFLYQEEYYNNLRKRLRISGPKRYSTLPDRAVVDVLSLYPGGLSPEDFLAKVENKLLWAERRGLPYTGVLIDGLHNVFVQFPLLQDARTFWPQLYNLLRRRSLNVVTTHTEFDLRQTTLDKHSLAVDFEHAQRKSAPLLSVMVSAADYVFELSSVSLPSGGADYRFVVRGMLGDNLPTGYFLWDRQALRLRPGVQQKEFDF